MRAADEAQVFDSLGRPQGDQKGTERVRSPALVRRTTCFGGECMPPQAIWSHHRPEQRTEGSGRRYCALGCEVDRLPQGLHEAALISNPLPGDIERGAVINRRPDYG